MEVPFDAYNAGGWHALLAAEREMDGFTSGSPNATLMFRAGLPGGLLHRIWPLQTFTF